MHADSLARHLVERYGGVGCSAVRVAESKVHGYLLWKYKLPAQAATKILRHLENAGYATVTGQDIELRTSFASVNSPAASVHTPLPDSSPVRVRRFPQGGKEKLTTAQLLEAIRLHKGGASFRRIVRMLHLPVGHTALYARIKEAQASGVYRSA